MRFAVSLSTSENANNLTNRTLRSVDARVGESLLQTAHRHDIELEGACEGVCACSTCHLIFPQEVYDKLPESSEEEEDMLDMAYGLTETSRLGCQVIVSKDMEGIEVKMPSGKSAFLLLLPSLFILSRLKI